MTEPPRTEHHASLIEAPPETAWGILRRLGPGLIIAGSIVGSGELIATTTTGAQAGFWLLWLILIGCVIKVFVQIELGRFTIVNGHSTMTGLCEVPGPTVDFSFTGKPGSRIIRGNWLVWYWFVMVLGSLGQLGGIVGGVGQALAISVPLTEAGRAYNEEVYAKVKLIIQRQSHRSQLTADLEKQAEQFKTGFAELSRDSALADAIAEAKAAEEKTSFKDGEAWRKTLQELSPQAAEIAPQVEIARRLIDQPQAVALVEMLDQGAWGESERTFHEIQAHDRKAKEYDQQADDDVRWAVIVTVITSIVLVIGRYGFIQTFSTVLVASFTLITVVNVFAIQTEPNWAVSWNDVVNGLSFRLTPKSEVLGLSPLATALATFGIIGVGANELISYPYWCLEKGYARFTGPRDDSPEWVERARGWMRVMLWDAWCSMVIYTFATVAFYLLGAAILGRIRLIPAGNEMIHTLGAMYAPVFGDWAQILFLFGAFAVLYSTFFVANASQARVIADAIYVFTRSPSDSRGQRFWIRFFSGLLPFVCLTIFIINPHPTQLVLIGGALQAINLPMLSGAALWFRYRRSDARVSPGLVWDLLLWLSAAGMLLAGGWLALTAIFPQLKALG